MNESSPINPPVHSNYLIHQQQQQQHRSDSRPNYDPYRQHTKMDYNNLD
jgi:hypothetical protein